MPRLRPKAKDEVDFVITFVAEHHQRNVYMQASKQKNKNKKHTKPKTKKNDKEIQRCNN